MNKFSEATGLFWGASLFLGALVCIIIGFRGNLYFDWIKAFLMGGCVFLITGLIFQGVVTLVKKTNND